MSDYATADACKSFRRNDRICADGFLQKPFCRGHGACVTCGKISAQSMPWCLREDIPSRFLKEDGTPRFYGEPNP